LPPYFYIFSSETNPDRVPNPVRVELEFLFDGRGGFWPLSRSSETNPDRVPNPVRVELEFLFDGRGVFP